MTTSAAALVGAAAEQPPSANRIQGSSKFCAAERMLLAEDVVDLL